jgi:type I restriction enzyme R subunit
VGSISEFKQIIGRGTRVRDDYGKYFFTILDYTGAATRMFADPDFDGDPEYIDEIEIDDEGNEAQVTVITPDMADESLADAEPRAPGWTSLMDEEPRERRKFYVDDGSVEIAHQLVYELDAQGKQLRVIQYADYTAESVRSLYGSAAALRVDWADPVKRSDIIDQLEERGIDFDKLAEAAQRPDADPFDLLCHVAFNAPLRTRREGADRLLKDKRDFFDDYGPHAREVLEELLEKYAEHGLAQFRLPDVLKLPPISERGNVAEIAKLFGGVASLRDAVDQLQEQLYAA